MITGTAASSAYAGEKVPPGGRVVNDFFAWYGFILITVAQIISPENNF